MVGLDIIRIETNLPLQCFRGDGGNWIAICEPLRITVQSETWAELMEDVADSVDALFQELLSTNELPRFLGDHGWQLDSPIPSQHGAIRFDVPFLPQIMGVPA